MEDNNYWIIQTGMTPNNQFYVLFQINKNNNNAIYKLICINKNNQQINDMMKKAFETNSLILLNYNKELFTKLSSAYFNNRKIYKINNIELKHVKLLNEKLIEKYHQIIVDDYCEEKNGFTAINDLLSKKLLCGNTHFNNQYNILNFEERKHSKILENKLKEDNILISGLPINATYNSPFTLPMMRRNEAMFKIDWNKN